MIESFYKAGLLLGGIAGLLSIVPLYIWGATGSWRAARHALGSYLRILAALTVVGGVVGLVMALAERIA